MSLANKLTVLRILLIPVFLLLLYLPIPLGVFWAAVVFFLASMTDILDGYIARRERKVTVFGKAFDPIADKLLVLAALVVLTERGQLHSLITILLLSREILISGFRIVISTKHGEVVAASWLGKTKTVLQDIAVILYLLRGVTAFQFLNVLYLPQIVMGAAIVFTIWSTVDYFRTNLKNFSTEE